MSGDLIGNGSPTCSELAILAGSNGITGNIYSKG